MAKFECTLQGGFDQALNYFHDGILNGSLSASFEDMSYFQSAGVRCAVRVYERFSWSGGNRLSMTLTLAGDGEKLFLSGITAGGSRGVMFKVNTWGEEAFLDELRKLVQQWQSLGAAPAGDEGQRK